MNKKFLSLFNISSQFHQYYIRISKNYFFWYNCKKLLVSKRFRSIHKQGFSPSKISYLKLCFEVLKCNIIQCVCSRNFVHDPLKILNFFFRLTQFTLISHVPLISTYVFWKPQSSTSSTFPSFFLGLKSNESEISQQYWLLFHTHTLLRTHRHTRPHFEWQRAKVKRKSESEVLENCRVPFHNLYRFVDRFVISLRLKHLLFM